MLDDFGAMACAVAFTFIYFGIIALVHESRIAKLEGRFEEKADD